MSEFNSHQSILRRACAFHDFTWPKNLSSGVLYFEGERITVEDFTAYKEIMQRATA